MELDGKRIAILAENMVNDLEFWYPYYRLKEAGAEVTVVGTGGAPSYTGKSGTSVPVDADAGNVSAEDFDGLVIPGGYAPDLMRRSPAMIALTRNIHEAGKPVAAICHAGWMLVSADLLRGRRVTSFFAIRDDMVNAGAEWVDEPVVVDGHLITSRTPDDLPDFLRAILAALSR